MNGNYSALGNSILPPVCRTKNLLPSVSDLPVSFLVLWCKRFPPPQTIQGIAWSGCLPELEDMVLALGWRKDSAVRRSHCSSRGPRYDSQHLHSSSCPSVSITSVPRAPGPSLALFWTLRALGMHVVHRHQGQTSIMVCCHRTLILMKPCLSCFFL